MYYKIINLIMFAVMVFMNYLANSLPINGKTTGQLSAEYPNLFVPAGVTFSIWGIIYIMLLVFVILQFFESNKLLVSQVGWAFAISCLFNALWIVAWHYQLLPLSLAVMLGLLASLIFIGIRMQLLPLSIPKAAFGIYLGWICIATIANVTAILVSYKWGGWGLADQTWAIVMIAIGALIVSITLIRINNPFVGLAVVWAFWGIVLKQKGLNPPIVIAAFIGIAVVGVLTLWLFVKGGVLSKA
jgi:hypothetical protein